MSHVMADFHAVTSDHRLRVPLRGSEDVVQVGRWITIEDIFGGGVLEGFVSSVDVDRGIAFVITRPQPAPNLKAPEASEPEITVNPWSVELHGNRLVESQSAKMEFA